MKAEFNMTEGQWNTSFNLEFIITSPQVAATVYIKLTNVTGGAKLGHWTTATITFPAQQRSSTTETWKYLVVILPLIGTGVLLIGIVLM